MRIPSLRRVPGQSQFEPYYYATTPREVKELRRITGLDVRLGDKVPKRLVVR